MRDYIYNQNRIPKNTWRYGFRSSAATGCGWIATFNALKLMGYDADPEKLIRYYEWQFPLINGNFGTLLFGPALFFRRKQFQVKMIFNRRKFDAAVKNSDVCILYYYWRRKFRIGSHFVTVLYRDGKYQGYNTYRNSDGIDEYGNSLEVFLKRRKYFFTVLIAIRDE